MPLATLALSIAMIWLLMRGDAAPGNFFVGLILAFILILFLRRTYGQERSFRRWSDIVRFIFYFTWELIVANLQVLRIVLSPRLHIRPGIIAFRTECKTPLSVTSLANSITLTPGTLSVDYRMTIPPSLFTPSISRSPIKCARASGAAWKNP